MAYSHVLVVYEATRAGDEALLAADLIAERDGAQLTVVATVELEAPTRWRTRWPRGTGTWNDVLLDRARADLERAERLLESAAAFKVLVGPERAAVCEAARELGADVIMLPSGRTGRWARVRLRDRAAAFRRDAPCPVMQPR